MSARHKKPHRDPESAPDGCELRFCPLCNDLHSISEFGVSRSRSDGLNRYCRKSNRKQAHAFRQRLKDYRGRKRPETTHLLQGTLLAPGVRVAPSEIRMYRVLRAIKEGARTQDDLTKVSKLLTEEIGIALADLLITRRLIGTRLIGATRIYFEL